jgi:hypothetical protein
VQVARTAYARCGPLRLDSKLNIFKEQLMNSQQKPVAGNPADAGADTSSKTPNTDMQPEDTGTPESGNEGARGNAAETAMKQTSKTGNEKGTGSGRS